LALAGSLGTASAQDYPPQPVAPGYAVPPPVYRDASGAPIDPRYVQPAPNEDRYSGGPDRASYLPPQPLPSPDDRPPAYVPGRRAT